MGRRPITYLAWLGAAAWLVAAAALPLSLLGEADRPSADHVLVAVGGAALALAFGRLRQEFRRGSAELVVAPDAGFLVLVAVAVDPMLAALAGLVVGAATAWKQSRWFDRAFAVATAMLGSAAPSVAAHGFVGDIDSNRSVLMAVVAAALVRTGIGLVAQLLHAELRVPGGARALLLGLPVGTIALLEAGLPVAVVGVAGPFVAQPALALLVVLAGQVLTWRILALQHDQFSAQRTTDQLLDTFQRYVPMHVAEAILQRPQDARTVVGGERRELTVMFIDIRGFTSWSERTDPDEVLTELNALLGDLADAVLATDGTIDKFTGDGLMAFWNAPTDQPDHATRAVQSLPKLLMRVREFNIRREVQRATPLEIGIGIATGPAMVGNIGHRERLAFTAIGDTVNLAARLEKATRDQGVASLIDERTFLALPVQVQRQFMRLESIEVKGRRERVRLYAPVALVRHRGTPAA